MIIQSDRRSQGGLKWWSQHLKSEELRWEQEDVEGLTVRYVLRCGLRVARRGGGVSIRGDSGKASRLGRRARKPAWLLDRLLLPERAGS